MQTPRITKSQLETEFHLQLEQNQPPNSPAQSYTCRSSVANALQQFTFARLTLAKQLPNMVSYMTQLVYAVSVKMAAAVTG